MLKFPPRYFKRLKCCSSQPSPLPSPEASVVEKQNPLSGPRQVCNILGIWLLWGGLLTSQFLKNVIVFWNLNAVRKRCQKEH